MNSLEHDFLNLMGIIPHELGPEEPLVVPKSSQVSLSHLKDFRGVSYHLTRRPVRVRREETSK